MNHAKADRTPGGTNRLGWSDAAAAGCAVALIAFFAHPSSRGIYEAAYAAQPALLSMFKMAILGTAGELLLVRVSRGRYRVEGFGLAHRLWIWGLLGLSIFCAFAIFSAGVGSLIFHSRPAGTAAMGILRAFCISLFMNIFFAPLMMLTHRILDLHLETHRGRFPLKGFSTAALLRRVDWERMWGFVFRKTIPFFWIPAHTLTFLLPPQYRMLYAALLSVVLGFFLALARQGPSSRQQPLVTDRTAA